MSERTYLANLSDGRASADEQRMGYQWINTLEAEARELRNKLRKLEGTDGHPEHRCDRCGGRNIWSWHADSDVWNRFAGKFSVGVLCPICFSELVELAGVPNTIWRLSIEGDDPEVSKLRVRLHARLEESARLGAELRQARYQLDLIRRALDLTTVGALLKLAPKITESTPLTPGGVS